MKYQLNNKYANIPINKYSDVDNMMYNSTTYKSHN